MTETTPVRITGVRRTHVEEVTKRLIVAVIAIQIPKDVQKTNGILVTLEIWIVAGKNLSAQLKRANYPTEITESTHWIARWSIPLKAVN